MLKYAHILYILACHLQIYADPVRDLACHLHADPDPDFRSSLSLPFGSGSWFLFYADLEIRFFIWCGSSTKMMGIRMQIRIHNIWRDWSFFSSYWQYCKVCFRDYINDDALCFQIWLPATRDSSIGGRFSRLIPVQQTGMDPLIPVPGWIQHRHFRSFRYWTDRMLDSLAFWR